MPPLRLWHISDVHLHCGDSAWRPGDYLSKRLTGWLNLTLRGRARVFADAARLSKIFRQQAEQEKPDAIVFSGDASAIGFSAEGVAAALALGVAEPSIAGVAVPGNHDHYVRSDPTEGDFERTFAPWQQGRRIDQHSYPFAREINGVWLVGVNSAVPNRLFWDARGLVGHAQLDRLERLFASLPNAPRVLVTHYPPCCANGSPEPYWHGLRDVAALKEVARRNGVVAWLCGHRHRAFDLAPDSDRPFVVCCAGSGTQDNLASFCEVTIDDMSVGIRRWRFDDVNGCYG